MDQSAVAFDTLPMDQNLLSYCYHCTNPWVCYRFSEFCLFGKWKLCQIGGDLVRGCGSRLKHCGVRAADRCRLWQSARNRRHFGGIAH